MSEDALPPLEEVIPHRRAMRMLDRLCAWSETTAVCERVVRAGDAFVEADGLSSLVAIELFAQAAAAHVGMHGRLRGGEIRSGALLGTRRLELRVDRFAVGDVLEVHIAQVMSMPPIAQYDCRIVRRGEAVAEGTVNVAMGDGGGR